MFALAPAESAFPLREEAELLTMPEEEEEEEELTPPPPPTGTERRKRRREEVFGENEPYEVRRRRLMPEPLEAPAAERFLSPEQEREFAEWSHASLQQRIERLEQELAQCRQQQAWYLREFANCQSQLARGRTAQAEYPARPPPLDVELGEEEELVDAPMSGEEEEEEEEEWEDGYRWASGRPRRF